VKDTVRRSIHEFVCDEDGDGSSIDGERRAYPSIADQAQRLATARTAGT
jgi:hypothetical protein